MVRAGMGSAVLPRGLAIPPLHLPRHGVVHPPVVPLWSPREIFLPLAGRTHPLPAHGTRHRDRRGAVPGRCRCTAGMRGAWLVARRAAGGDLLEAAAAGVRQPGLHCGHVGRGVVRPLPAEALAVAGFTGADSDENWRGGPAADRREITAQPVTLLHLVTLARARDRCAAGARGSQRDATAILV